MKNALTREATNRRKGEIEGCWKEKHWRGSKSIGRKPRVSLNSDTGPVVEDVIAENQNKDKVTRKSDPALV